MTDHDPMRSHSRTAGITAALTAICALLSACAVPEPPAGAGPPGKAGARPPGRTFVYQCPDGFRFTASIEGEAAWLFLPHRTLRLPQVPSASGTRYSDGETTFWSQGEEARLATGAQARSGCRNDRAAAVWEDAKLRGVAFRAVGQEPGWHLEIIPGGQTVLIMDYGATRYAFETPEPDIGDAGATATYAGHAEGQSLTVVLQAIACRDSMSGEAFETTVTVTVNGKRFTGCGRPLH